MAEQSIDRVPRRELNPGEIKRDGHMEGEKRERERERRKQQLIPAPDSSGDCGELQGVAMSHLRGSVYTQWPMSSCEVLPHFNGHI